MANVTTPPRICEEGGSGLIFPFVPNEHEWTSWMRAILYIILLFWCFLGVAIVSDTFMSAIERITSQRRRKFNAVTGRFVTVVVWNPTVANLTLMALGSSAPEILLSVIEILGNEFYSGDLGPSTIVGSAAFNLFIIIAVCVTAIPDGETRAIKEMPVYMVTAAFSIFAYLWLLIILTGISPNVVEVWEAVFTFLLFPALVGIAYIADLGYFGSSAGAPKMGRGWVMTADMSKEELADLEADIRARHGDGGKLSLSREAVAQIMEIEGAEFKSRAKYRQLATAKLSGSRSGSKLSGSRSGSRKVFAQESPRQLLHKMTIPGQIPEPPTSDPARIVPFDDDDDLSIEPTIEQIYFTFDCGRRAVMENGGKVTLRVTRYGGDSRTASVGYRTCNGSGRAAQDFVHAEGRLSFGMGEMEKSFTVEIIDNEEPEMDREFYAELVSPEAKGQGTQALLGEMPKMTVTIIDDDKPGAISFLSESMDVDENPAGDKQFSIVVERKHGASGKVSCSYRTDNASAVANTDFEPLEGILEFDHGECQKIITGTIKETTRYQKSTMFRVILADPQGGAKFDDVTDGGQDLCILTVFINAKQVSRDPIEKMKSNFSVRWDKAKTGNANWASQFKDAIFVGVEDAQDEDEDAKPGITEWALHIATWPWKLFFAFIPPTDYCGGWLCFCASLGMIGIVTAIIGDVASLFGCCVGIPDQVTAFTLVALGTSLPDTFASKTAATQDPQADASIGNVTGSNSVNVFLGLGMPWTIGAIYWALGTTAKWRGLYADDPEVPEAFRGGAFIVKAGDLGFSVMVFTVGACVCVAILQVRRMLYKGELGGPKIPKVVTVVALCSIWFFYIGLSTWKVMSSS